jgi:hypothetical protein
MQRTEMTMPWSVLAFRSAWATAYASRSADVHARSRCQCHIRDLARCCGTISQLILGTPEALQKRNEEMFRLFLKSGTSTRGG